jgi:hypothetical protein
MASQLFEVLGIGEDEEEEDGDTLKSSHISSRRAGLDDDDWMGFSDLPQKAPKHDTEHDHEYHTPQKRGTALRQSAQTVSFVKLSLASDRYILGRGVGLIGVNTNSNTDEFSSSIVAQARQVGSGAIPCVTDGAKYSCPGYALSTVVPGGATIVATNMLDARKCLNVICLTCGEPLTDTATFDKTHNKVNPRFILQIHPDDLLLAERLCDRMIPGFKTLMDHVDKRIVITPAQLYHAAGDQRTWDAMIKIQPNLGRAFLRFIRAYNATDAAPESMGNTRPKFMTPIASKAVHQPLLFKHVASILNAYLSHIDTTTRHNHLLYKEREARGTLGDWCPTTILQNGSDDGIREDPLAQTLRTRALAHRKAPGAWRSVIENMKPLPVPFPKSNIPDTPKNTWARNRQTKGMFDLPEIESPQLLDVLSTQEERHRIFAQLPFVERYIVHTMGRINNAQKMRDQYAEDDISNDVPDGKKPAVDKTKACWEHAIKMFKVCLGVALVQRRSIYLARMATTGQRYILCTRAAERLNTLIFEWQRAHASVEKIHTGGMDDLRETLNNSALVKNLATLGDDIKEARDNLDHAKRLWMNMKHVLACMSTHQQKKESSVEIHATNASIEKKKKQALKKMVKHIENAASDSKTLPHATSSIGATPPLRRACRQRFGRTRQKTQEARANGTRGQKS